MVRGEPHFRTHTVPNDEQSPVTTFGNSTYQRGAQTQSQKSPATSSKKSNSFTRSFSRVVNNVSSPRRRSHSVSRMTSPASVGRMTSASPPSRERSHRQRSGGRRGAVDCRDTPDEQQPQHADEPRAGAATGREVSPAGHSRSSRSSRSQAESPTFASHLSSRLRLRKQSKEPVTAETSKAPTSKAPTSKAPSSPELSAELVRREKGKLVLNSWMHSREYESTSGSSFSTTEVSKKIQSKVADSKKKGKGKGTVSLSKSTQGSLGAALVTMKNEYDYILAGYSNASSSLSEDSGDSDQKSLQEKEIYTGWNKSIQPISSVSSSASDSDGSSDDLRFGLSAASSTSEGSDEYDSQIKKYLDLVQTNQKNIDRFVRTIETDHELRQDCKKKTKFLNFMKKHRPFRKHDGPDSKTDTINVLIDQLERAGADYRHTLLSTTTDAHPNLYQRTKLDAAPRASPAATAHPALPPPASPRTHLRRPPTGTRPRPLFQYLVDKESARLRFLALLLNGDTEQAKRMVDSSAGRLVAEVLEYATDNLCDQVFGWEDPLYADDVSTCSHFDWGPDQGEERRFVDDSSAWFDDVTRESAPEHPPGGLPTSEEMLTHPNTKILRVMSQASLLIDDEVVDQTVEILGKIQRSIHKKVGEGMDLENFPADKSFMWGRDKEGYVTQSEVWLRECTKLKSVK